MSFTKEDIKILKQMFDESEKRLERVLEEKLEKKLEQKLEQKLDQKMDQKFAEFEERFTIKVKKMIQEANDEQMDMIFKHFATREEIQEMIDNALSPVKSDVSKNAANISKHEYILQASGLKDQHKI